MATLAGGTLIKIPRPERDALEDVFVRQLPVRLYGALRDCLADEAKQVELYCNQEPGWADSLTPSDHELIIKTGKDLNWDFFSRWLERQKAMRDLIPKQDVGEVVQMLDALQKSNPALLEDLMRKAGATLPTTLLTAPSRAV